MTRLGLINGVAAIGLIVSSLSFMVILIFVEPQHRAGLWLSVLCTTAVLVFLGSSVILVSIWARLKASKNKIQPYERPTQQLVSPDLRITQQILFQIARANLDAPHHRAQRQQAKKKNEKPISANRVLFITSNGGGLGHVSRTLAIAAEFDGDVRFFTLSRGYPLIADAGYQGVYVPSHEYSGTSRKGWGRILTAALVNELTTYSPDLVVFDGAAIYPEVRGVTETFRIPFVWLRRGLWKKDVRLNSRQYNFPETVCDYLLEPSDLALRNTEILEDQTEPTPRKFLTSAIVNLKPEQMLSRRTALKDLQLSANKRYVLIQLGAGNINDIRDAETVAADAVHKLGPEWLPVIARSPIAKTSPVSNWPIINRFPIASYLKAFEFGVISGGYNSVQEALSLGLPCISVPNSLTHTDDQVARSSAAAQRGLMLEANNTDDIVRAIVKLSDVGQLERMRRNVAQIPYPQGACESASILERIADDNKRNQPLPF